MKKAVCIVRQYPELVKELDEMDVLFEGVKSQIDFIAKRAEKISDTWDVTRGDILKRVESICREKGLLPPEYAPDWKMVYDKSAGVLYARDNEKSSSPFDSLINALIGPQNPR